MAVKFACRKYACSECGKAHRFPAYVFAHWRSAIIHECPCGARHSLKEGVPKLTRRRPSRARRQQEN